MKESSVESKVVAYAERRGILHLKLSVKFRRGWPDHLFCIPGGKPVFIEFKRPGERPTKLQMFVMDKLEKVGYNVYWTSGAEEAIDYLKGAITEAAIRGA